MRKTKIVCTLGPATNDKEIIKEVVEAGMDVARMNFSHGDHAEHKQRMDLVKAAEKETGKTVGIMLDTKGPEIRTGEMKGDKIQLEAETELVITREDVEGTTEMISVSYKDLAQDMDCLLYTSPSPRDRQKSRMPSSA